jgi:hypothetical protein
MAVADRLADTAHAREPTVVGLLVAPGCSVLAVQLRAERRGSAPVDSATAGPRTQRALRTILAANLVRSRIDGDDSATAVRSFCDALSASFDPDSLAVVVSTPAAVPMPGAARFTCDSPAGQSLLACLEGWREADLAATAAGPT